MKTGPLATALIPVLLAAAPQARAADGPLAQAVGAPDGLAISATVRSRLESIDGQFRPDRPESDMMLSFATTLAAEYDTGPVRFGAEVWDARAVGQDPNSSAGTGEINALELVQAYVRLDLGDQAKGAKGNRATVTAGRFTLDIGSRRLVARQRFRNSTNAYTGVHADLADDGGRRLQLLWSMPHLRLPDDAEGILKDRVVWDQETTDLQLYGAHLTLPRILGGSLELYGFGLSERDSAERATRNRRLASPGMRLFRKPGAGKWDHDIEAVYQFGKVRRTVSARDTTDLDLSAWFIHAELGYTIAGGWKPRISAHFDGASGDDNRPGTFGRYDTLFSARRFELGPTGLFGAVQRANLLSPGVRLEVTPSKRMDGFVMARALWAENATDSFSVTGVRDATGSSGRYAGTQIEGRVRYWIVPGLLQADGGAALLAKGSLLRNAPNAPATGDTTYAYFDLILTL